MTKVYKNLTTDQITQLKFQAGEAATELLDDLISKNDEKLDSQFPVADNGKILQIGADGKVVPLMASEVLTIPLVEDVTDATLISNLSRGQIIYDTTNNKLCYFDGTNVVTLVTESDGDDDGGDDDDDDDDEDGDEDDTEAGQQGE